jgi:hypothetical protein
VTSGTAGTERRGPFDVDTDRSLGAIRLEWGDGYVACYDSTEGIEGGRWRAWRLDDGGTMLTEETPDELSAALRADWGARSAG